MKPEIHDHLYELDATGWYWPDEFDYNAAMSEARQLKPEIEEIIGHPMWQDTSVQDASYFTEFLWLDEERSTPGKGGARALHIGVRFSNFDRMVTVFSGNGDEKEFTRFESQIARVLNAHGYRYIPKSVLGEEYPGAEDWMGNWSWFSRFFGYL